MIVAVARVTTDAERRDALLAAGRAVVTATRAEAGCLGYTLYEDVDKPNAFVFIEEWEDQAALDAHFQTAHVASFMEAIAPTLAAPPDVQFHTVASSTGLPGS